MKPCGCGGEMWVDSFDPIKRPVEYFLRCTTCGQMTEPCASPDEAEAAVAAPQADAA